MLRRGYQRTSFSSLTRFKSASSLVSGVRQSRVITTLTPEEYEAQRKPDRPLSPHVTIYKFPLPAITSITTRITGVALTVGVYGTALVCLQSPHDLIHLVDAFKEAAPFLVPVTKILVSFPFVYHTVSGIRHLMWDQTLKGLDLVSADTSSKVVIAVSAILTLGLGFYTIH